MVLQVLRLAQVVPAAVPHLLVPAVVPHLQVRVLLLRPVVLRQAQKAIHLRLHLVQAVVLHLLQAVVRPQVVVVLRLHLALLRQAAVVARQVQKV